LGRYRAQACRTREVFSHTRYHRGNRFRDQRGDCDAQIEGELCRPLPDPRRARPHRGSLEPVGLDRAQGRLQEVFSLAPSHRRHLPTHVGADTQASGARWTAGPQGPSHRAAAGGVHPHAAGAFAPAAHRRPGGLGGPQPPRHPRGQEPDASFRRLTFGERRDANEERLREVVPRASDRAEVSTTRPEDPRKIAALRMIQNLSSARRYTKGTHPKMMPFRLSERRRGSPRYSRFIPSAPWFPSFAGPAI
jgi:hypothetical protein